MGPYDPKKLEPKWQQLWEERQTYKVDLASQKPKYFAMSMFNYPSGSGIHVGHAMTYTISDVMARFRRQQGFASYHPIGWDAFGLPAENYAIKSGVSPQESMARIIPDYHKQYQAMGWSNDWSKEISTHEPAYYKWTQWIFAEMFRAGLAYQDARMQWWCSIDNTVLADEQVTADGKCWRHDGTDDPPVEKREIKQWFFKITDYAEELLAAIPELDWTDSVKVAQTNWIGKSEGALIKFAVVNSEDSKQKEGQSIAVFTTRPDTLFGATFLVLAPEHELVAKITAAKHQAEVKAYQETTAKKSDVERQADKTKTGVFTGAYALNPASGAKMPIWIAEYVLASYGTGAIMAVPAHDQRDFDFATKFKLPIETVIEPVSYATGATDTFRPDEAVIERSPVVCIVKHWQEDKYLTLRWKSNGWLGFIIGGVEKGEDNEQAGLREIKEETGYLHAKFVKELSGQVHGKFYQHLKKENRFAHFTALYFELKDGQQEPIAEHEAAIHELLWFSADALEQQITHEDMRLIWQKFRGNEDIWTGEGVLVNSGKYSGLESPAAREQIIQDLAKQKLATAQTNYRLQDWSVSRQRYWGAPIPIIYCPKCGPQLVPEAELPVVLPEIKDYQPTGDGRSALARAADWLKAKCPNCGGVGERETDTLDTYLDSAWYFLRYLDPANPKQAFEPKIANHWMPVDFYNGADHATAHMIYARFITRFFHKLGLVDNPEPFQKFLFNGKVVAADGKNFSKTLGNGPDPLDIINSGYGADALRTYLMFAAPLEQWVRWDVKGVPGTYRFLTRVWNLVRDFLAIEPDSNDNLAVLRLVHPVILKVSEDIEQQKYNTAIAAAMQLTNELYLVRGKREFSGGQSWRFALESLVQLIAPFAPHIADEMWAQLGHTDSVHVGHWPSIDKQYLVQSEITVVVQVNGKTRGTISVPTDVSEKAMVATAQNNPKVATHLAGKTIAKTITVPHKLVNFVIK